MRTSKPPSRPRAAPGRAGPARRLRGARGRRSACGTTLRVRRETRARRPARPSCRRGRSAPARRAPARRRVRAVSAIAPWPTAGRNVSMSSTARARWARPRRLKPASASSVASISPRLGLAQPRLDVAAQQLDAKVRAQPQRLRLAAQRGGAEPRAVGQGGDRIGDGRNQRVAHVLAFGRKPAIATPSGSSGRQILGRMHRDVDPPVEERRVDFLGEQPLAAGLGERPILDHVAAGADDRDARRAPRPSHARARAAGASRAPGRGRAASRACRG